MGTVALLVAVNNAEDKETAPLGSLLSVKSSAAKLDQQPL
jgi:hypothetical protein